MNPKSVHFFSLFASSATLICCALPALFVALGAGAVFASLITVFPFLILLSHYKVYITLFALVTIIMATYVHYKSGHLPCPTDPELGRICMDSRRRSRYVYYFSVALFLFATLFTYIVPLLI